MRTAAPIILILAITVTEPSADPSVGNSACTTGQRPMTRDAGPQWRHCRAAVENIVIDAPARVTAEEAVGAMLGAYSRRSIKDYAIWFAPDYVFESYDPVVRERSPNRLSRAEELQSAQNLFEGNPLKSLPRALRIDVSSRKMVVDRVAASGTARVVVAGLRVVVALSDGSRIDTGEGRHELYLMPTPTSWLIQKWVEMAPGDSGTALAARAANTVAPRLRLAVVSQRGSSALDLEVELPRRGGTVELFDVQGRRIHRLDINDLSPGVHRVSLDGTRLASGVYWARLLHASDAVTTRVTWLR